MTLQTTGIHHLAIRVSSLARSRAFYVDTLGFQPIVEVPGLVILNANGSLLGIRGGAQQTAPGDKFDPFRIGLDHLALGVAKVEDLADLKAELDRSDVRNNGIEDDPLLGTRYISFYDPDGIAWELYAPPA